MLVINTPERVKLVWKSAKGSKVTRIEFPHCDDDGEKLAWVWHRDTVAHALPLNLVCQENKQYQDYLHDMVIEDRDLADEHWDEIREWFYENSVPVSVDIKAGSVVYLERGDEDSLQFRLNYVAEVWNPEALLAWEAEDEGTIHLHPIAVGVGSVEILPEFEGWVSHNNVTVLGPLIIDGESEAAQCARLEAMWELHETKKDAHRSARRVAKEVLVGKIGSNVWNRLNWTAGSKQQRLSTTATVTEGMKQAVVEYMAEKVQIKADQFKKLLKTKSRKQWKCNLTHAQACCIFSSQRLVKKNKGSKKCTEPYIVHAGGTLELKWSRATLTLAFTAKSNKVSAIERKIQERNEKKVC